LAALGLGLLSAVACRLAGGPTLGLYLAPLLFAGLLVPPLVLAVEIGIWRGLIPLLFTIGVSAIWLTTGPAPWGEMAACALVLLAVTGLAAGLAIGLARPLHSPVAGGALAVVILLLWLTWPIWLSASLESASGQRFTQPLVSVQPLLAVNGIVPELGIWTQQRVMYHLTTLGQHVSYALPGSIWPCVLFHARVGAALGALARPWWKGSPAACPTSSASP
jgi:hypothetical protein